MRQHARAVFEAALKAVDPVGAVRKYVKVADDTLQVGEHRFAFKDFDRILVAGAGKAGASDQGWAIGCSLYPVACSCRAVSTGGKVRTG